MKSLLIALLFCGCATAQCPAGSHLESGKDQTLPTFAQYNGFVTLGYPIHVGDCFRVNAEWRVDKVACAVELFPVAPRKGDHFNSSVGWWEFDGQVWMPVAGGPELVPAVLEDYEYEDTLAPLENCAPAKLEGGTDTLLQVCNFHKVKAQYYSCPSPDDVLLPTTKSGKRWCLVVKP